MKIKYISLLLLLALIISSFSACMGRGDFANVSTTPEDTITPEPIPETLTVVAIDGTSPYTIIRSANATITIEEEYRDLIATLIDKTDAYFRNDTDRQISGTDLSQKSELLFGPTTREESKEVYASIGFDGYAVRYINKKIVIAAYTYENLCKAVDVFFSECTILKPGEDGKANLDYVKDFTYEGTSGLFFTKDNPIEDYKIVYASNYAAIASNLASAIEKYQGVKLECVSDATPATEKEILLGETNRAENSQLQNVDRASYGVKVVGSKILIKSGLESHASYLLKPLINTYLYTAPVLNFPKNVNAQDYRYSPEQTATLAEGADLRIMSFNILNQQWMDRPETVSRVPGVIGCLSYYMPDVAGLQEVDPIWYKFLDLYLGEDYVFVNRDCDGVANYNYTAIAYNKHTVTLIESETTYYTSGSRRIRMLNMALFEHKATGERFIVTSTHFAAGEGEAVRLSHAIEFARKINEYAEKYKVPMFCTGDYNSWDDKPPYLHVVENTPLRSSKHDAMSKGTVGKILQTSHGLGTRPILNVKSIDHILYTGATLLYYTTLMDDNLAFASDHTPIYADYKFN